ncbi:hypothetical protein SAMN05428989_1206 [Pseudoxanthomonas sp. GM95]|uniref:DUF6152 family protein n=1 Tax=Pseudoxanthomonas sp. GM95 TaxID=1881043 RepID=UPI0008BCD632|nr:DUF6152 family protein [Pseudoxanthomonas sp. GM95]SEK98596.1 hypothetical protein SAMN05428989_1206 [Pseudoxanthomonas sp. GM95]
MHRAVLPILAAALAVSLPALAHHGWSSYDASKALKISAPLTAVQYRNPHAEVSVDYQGKAWNAVLAPIARMNSRGLPDGALTVGKTITIEGYPRLDGTAELRAERITVDGKTIELR